ncbi:hypothetical protein SNEBB_000897 [Seison nebaliae]|nr:hypothetical protein SNEBB_000897 [Seison nebaliae]
MDNSYSLRNDDFRKFVVDSSNQLKKNNDKQKKMLRKKKKQPYIQKREEELRREQELNEKYVDRAAERRKRELAEQQATGTGQELTRKEFKLSSQIFSDKNRQVPIEESKWLGGDMTHTHMVKGLDYSLLQRVRKDIEKEENRVRKEELKKQKNSSLIKEEEKEIGEESKLVRKINKYLEEKIENKKIACNEFFVPGRMAYVMDMEDVPYLPKPNTLIRSIADCRSKEKLFNVSESEITLRELSIVLSYYRSGKKGKKKKLTNPQSSNKIEKNFLNDLSMEKEQKSVRFEDIPNIKNFPSDDHPTNDDFNIFENVGKYVPDYEIRTGNKEEKTRNYFNSMKKNNSEEENNEMNKEIDQITAQVGLKISQSKSAQDDYYTECYPGTMAEIDVDVESDDEPDFTSMDNVKNQEHLPRWTFNDDEEYSNYMQTKEANPVAAFQYGVKVDGGRKTKSGLKNLKKNKQLDRDWDQIKNLIDTDNIGIRKKKRRNDYYKNDDSA